MKKILKSVLGVTLLEVLLVLVIASLVLVMSIRYYQTASGQAKVNAGTSIVMGLITSVDSYVASGGLIGGVANCGGGSETCQVLASYLPNGKLPASPWGNGYVGVDGSAVTSYNIIFPAIPASDCTNLQRAATTSGTSTKVSSSTTCGTTGATPLTLKVTP